MPATPPAPAHLRVEPLEDRAVPAVAAELSGGTLTVATDAADQRVQVGLDPRTGELVVRDAGAVAGRFATAEVARLAIVTGAGDDKIEVAPDVVAPAEVDAGGGRNAVEAGGGPAVVRGGPGADKLAAGAGGATLLGGGGDDLVVAGPGADTLDAGNGQARVVAADPADTVLNPAPVDPTMMAAAEGARAADERAQLTADEVEVLLDRASAATSSRDGIIAVVDRNGRVLGVRVEGGVDPAVTGDTGRLVFAVDGAVAKARTGAFFGNDQAPLTSRTIQFISQSTVTEREVNSNPNVRDPNSPDRGPGYVAAVGVGGHFPPGVANTPQVDLFGIEHTNRDGSSNPGPDRIKGTADDIPYRQVTNPGADGRLGTPDDIPLNQRFNIDPAFVPAGQELFPPDSFGVTSGLLPGAQSRGIATLPGGVPVVRGGRVVGGIGVFYPGKTGFATEENSLSSATPDQTADPKKLDRSLEAEFAAFAAVGGSRGAGFSFAGPVGDAPAAPDKFDLPFDRIDLVGITLPLFGPGGVKGPENLVRFGVGLGTGSRAGGQDLPVARAPDGAPVVRQAGRPVPFGWLVTPHDGNGVTAAEVMDIISRGASQATQTRAAIRVLGNSARMVFAVADLDGRIVGLFRMPDATIFSIDVAVAKARNVNYYANAAKLQPEDRTPFVPPGTAFTNRTFRYLSEPQFPEGIDGNPPAPFSILVDGNANPRTGRLNGPPKPASAFRTVFGYDSFNPGTNFRDPTNILNQNGIVFFPGSAPLYRQVAGGVGPLIGGFGVSGDGVDQDDVVTFAGTTNFGVPNPLLRADETRVAGVRLPYQKFNRNPEGGIPGPAGSDRRVFD